MSLKVAIVGTGWFAKMHADLLSGMEDVRVAAFCGTSQEKAQRYALAYEGAEGFACVEEMLDKIRPDAVYISVPPFAHGAIEAAIAERGIPMFIEKPVGLDLNTPRDILQAIKKYRVMTSVGYHFRYMDSTSLAKDKLCDSRIGMALGYWNGSMPMVGWWRKQDGSGGQFVEQTTHIADLLRYTLGEVTEVYAAYAQRAMYEKAEGVQVADVGTVTLKLASGAVANITNTCLLPFGHKAELQVFTDEGVFELSGKGLNEIREGTTVWTPNRSNPYEKENIAFLHAVRTGDTAGILSDYEDAFRTQQVTVAALESANKGTPVRLEESL